MQAHRVVKAFEVFENGRSGLRLILEVGAIHALTLEFVEERFHGGMIVTVRRAAHAHFNAPFRKARLVAEAGVLTTPIRMVQQALLRMPTSQRHLQG